MKSLALIDFDGTIYKGDSMLDFARFLNGGRYYFSLGVIFFPYLLMRIGLFNRNRLKRLFLRINFKGLDKTQMHRAGEAFFEKFKDRCYPKACSWINEKQKEGQELIIVSASSGIWLQPFADHLGVRLICTQLAFDGKGRCTGDWVGENLWGAAKVQAVRSSVDLESFDHVEAYGNEAADKSLEAVAEKVYLNYFIQ